MPMSLSNFLDAVIVALWIAWGAMHIAGAIDRNTDACIERTD